MSPVSVHAVLGFFRNAHCISVGRSSSASARVSAPSVVKAVRFPALRACSTFDISGADLGVLLLMDVPAFGRWEMFVKMYASVVFQYSADFSYGARGHTLSVVFYGHGMNGAVSHCLSSLEIKT